MLRLFGETVMVDIKELLELKEKLTNFHSIQLDKLGFPPEAKESFFKIVDDRFEKSDKTPSSYEGIIKNTFYQTIRIRNKLFRKWEKKAIKNRGNIVWDSSNGTMKRNDYGTEK
jgi:hypothetical protein